MKIKNKSSAWIFLPFWYKLKVREFNKKNIEKPQQKINK